MAYAQANMFNEREGWRQPLILSVGFHVLVVLSMIAFSYVMAPHTTSKWGENEGDAVTAQMVSRAPIPIPTHDVQTDNIVASDTKSVAPIPPQPAKPVETEDGISIPGKKPTPKPQQQKTVASASIPSRPIFTPTPQTAVPYGEAPAASNLYGGFTAPNTKGGFTFQNANFGSKYGWYVDVVRRKIESNWLTYEIDPRINAPHRAYISFDIMRDGSPKNVKIAQSSGVPSLDQSAMRAIQRVDTFGNLPEGNSVSVEFWFDYPPK
jgi:protein TonB